MLKPVTRQIRVAGERLGRPGHRHCRDLLPAPTKRERVAALVSAPDDPWWEERVLHAMLYPAKGRWV
ncbi:hypothetical protein [Kitasatospora sp. NPDC017646]|uniref:hypothetical protein n=1 Tax=Kitasatospora sp. NPDC017646 TaxID=3364024 RepID=UPI0037BD4A97